MTSSQTSAKLHDRLRETADELEALQREHEFICRKCGLRQDNPNQIEGNF